MRKLFTEAFNKDFDVLSDELVNADISRGLYWLVRVRPKRSGFFIIRYINTYPLRGDTLPFKEHELHIKVGERGCRRNLLRYRPFANVCLGDVVILPINLNDFTEPSFSPLSSDEKQARSEAEASEAAETADLSSLITSTVNNPCEPSLKYIGHRVSFLMHRDLNTVTVGADAVFEAKSPGRFNLNLKSRLPEALLPYRKEERQDWSFSVIIQPGDAPVTIIAPYERIVEYDRKRTPRVYNSQLYQVSVLQLQPGDQMSFGFFSQRWRRNTDEWKRIEPLIKEIEPVIERLPFSLQSGYEYNDWLMKYL